MSFFKKHKIIILILVALFILIECGVILLLIKGNGDKVKLNNYDYNDEIVELPNTVIIEGEKLSSKQCLKGICISDAKFYYNSEMGRVEYTITNTSKKKASGYLKMVFGDQYLVIVYKDLKPNKSIKSESQFMDLDIKDKHSYKLEELSKEEINKIK